MLNASKHPMFADWPYLFFHPPLKSSLRERCGELPKAVLCALSRSAESNRLQSSSITRRFKCFALAMSFPPQRPFNSLHTIRQHQHVGNIMPFNSSSPGINSYYNSGVLATAKKSAGISQVKRLRPATLYYSNIRKRTGLAQPVKLLL